MTFLITPLRQWYGKFERPISSISLIGGFVFDAITLKRVDFFWENLWTVGHLLIVATCIILINLQEHEDIDPTDTAKAHFWYINILQFFFGGLLSTFLVFYFRSSTLSVTWPFLLLLVIAFIANERLKQHYTRLTFQISLFYLCILSFTIFIVPVFVHRIGGGAFFISGLVSLLILWAFLRALQYYAGEKFRKSKVMLAVSISSIFIVVNMLYFSGLIPPIPLSLKDAGVYHSIYRDGNGDFVVQLEDQGWLNYFSLHEKFHAVEGRPIYAYSAIFSPAQFNLDVIHDWQQYDPATGQWVSVTRTTLPVSGGRDGGYRTYSVKENITPGSWRVNVETVNGQIIGRLRFDVIPAITEPNMKTEVKT